MNWDELFVANAETFFGRTDPESDLDALLGPKVPKGSTLAGEPGLAPTHALELGSGSGRLLRAASLRFDEVTGADVSMAAMSRARSVVDGDASIHLFDLTTSPWDTLQRRFDTVYSYACLAHLTPRIVAEYLLAIEGWLRPGGQARLHLLVGDEVLFHERDVFSVRSYDRDRLRSACEAAGMHVVSMDPLILPFDGVDHELNRHPIVLHLVRSGREPRSKPFVLDQLAGRIEPCDGPPSEDAYRLAITRVHELVRAGGFTDALRICQFLKGVFPERSELMRAVDVMQQAGIV